VPAFYHIDKERKLVMSTASGVLTRKDLADHMRRLLADPDFNPSFSQLADFSHITGIDFTADDVRAFARKDVFSPGSRRAFIVANDESESLAGMFAILREVAGERGIRVFRTLEEGIDWIIPRLPKY
jgi:hypothetical protein